MVWTIGGAVGFAYVFAVGERLAQRVAGPPELSAAVDKGDVETRLAALERNFDRTREFFISLTIALLAGLYLKPVGSPTSSSSAAPTLSHIDPVSVTDPCSGVRVA